MNKFSKPNNMNKLYKNGALIALFLGASVGLYSQSANTAINVAGNRSANPAILDLSDVSNAHLGFLMPNVSLQSTTDNTTITGAANGLIVWNTNNNLTQMPLGTGYYYWSGTNWLYINNSGNGSPLTGSGIAGYIARWTSGTDLGTGVTQDNGLGVSISSMALTPANMLDVNGNAAFGSYAGTSAPANGIIIPGQLGIGTSTPDASASLDVYSTSGGLLIPQLTSVQITTLTALPPATGLMIVNSTTGCMEYWSGSAWQNISCPCSLGTPNQPSGNTSPTISTAYTYTTATVAGATSYFWSVSTTNGTITSGQGSTSATITFSGTPATMNICVYAINGFCTSATACLSVLQCAHIIPSPFLIREVTRNLLFLHVSHKLLLLQAGLPVEQVMAGVIPGEMVQP
jgi:hypothetical protein